MNQTLEARLMQRNWSQETYIKAYRFAAEAHNGQMVPGSNLPYIMHVSFVSMEIIAALSMETERKGDLALQCALLHDVLEDTTTTYDQLNAEFGNAVADGVLALTKNTTLVKPLQLEDSLHRICQQPQEVWMVKLADRITNLQPPPSHWTQEKIIRYREEALQIYVALKDASSLLAVRLMNKIESYGKSA